MTEKTHRPLETGDVVQIGDQWYNPDWHWDELFDDKQSLQGPWYTVTADMPHTGKTYDAATWRKMRRPV